MTAIVAPRSTSTSTSGLGLALIALLAVLILAIWLGIGIGVGSVPTTDRGPTDAGVDAAGTGGSP